MSARTDNGSLLHAFRWPVSLGAACALSFAILALLSVVQSRLPDLRAERLLAVLKPSAPAPVQTHAANPPHIVPSHNPTPAATTPTTAPADTSRITREDSFEQLLATAPPASGMPTATAEPRASAGGNGASISREPVAANAAPSRGVVCPVEIKPGFPQQAQDFGVTHGEVLAQLQIARDGRVSDVKILRAEPKGYFEQAVRRAALQWHCESADNERLLNVPFVLRLAG